MLSEKSLAEEIPLCLTDAVDAIRFSLARDDREEGREADSERYEVSV